MRAALQAIYRADEAHEADCCATEAGRRASALRLRGRAAAASGCGRHAVELIQQAVACFPSDGDSAGRAAALHDLATARSHVVTHPFELHGIRDTFEQAVASPARRRHLHHWAFSASMLAATLRQLSGSGDELDRAEALFREAIAIVEALDAWRSASDYWFNLGNLLRGRQREPEALAAYQRALAWMEPFPADQDRPTLPRTLTAIAELKRARGRAGDRRDSTSAIRRAIKLDHVESHAARLVLARWYLEDHRPERARAVLADLDVGALGIQRLEGAVQVLEQAGLVTKAVAHLRRVLDQQFRERAATIADLRSDVATASLQTCAAMLARLLLRHDRALDAFLVRDSVSGLRFAENMPKYVLGQADPVTRDLWAQFEHYGSNAAKLDEILHRMELLPPDAWRDACDSWLRAIDALDDADVLCYRDTAAALRETTAGTALDLTRLIQARDDAAARTSQASDALAAHDPSYRRDAGPLHTDLSADELRALLPPDTVLLRIDLQDVERLSVIAVWVREHVLTARHALVAVPRELFPDLAAFARCPRAAQVGPLEDALARIDLSVALGGHAFAHAVVLPDPAAARLPLAALGPVGNRLLDPCEDITWLPTCCRSAPGRRRTNRGRHR